MEDNILIITAQAVNFDKTLSAIKNSHDMPVRVEEGEFCGVLTGIVTEICRQMNVEILKSECFEKDNRMALVVRADAAKANISLDVLRHALEMGGHKVSASIRVQKEGLFRYMHRI